MLPETDFWILYQEMTQRTAALMQEQFVNSIPVRSIAASEKGRKNPNPTPRLNHRSLPR